MEYLITTFYKFTALDQGQLPAIKQALEQQAKKLDIAGLVLIAPEGINATIAGQPADIMAYQQFLTKQFGAISYKNSQSDFIPFKRFKVKVKPEIVQLKRTDVQPDGTESHLSPQAWDQLLAQKDLVMIDVRNWYEAKVGTFKQAINPQTKRFSEFPDWLKKSGLAKEQPIGIFCTGGIRCEKAALVLKEQGYEQVHQLEGGILNYLEQRPNHNFAGECFVFDQRSAVGQDLRPSQHYKICTTCGNAGSIEKNCVNCNAVYRICDDCLAVTTILLCSKNCRYRHQQTAQKLRQR